MDGSVQECVLQASKHALDFESKLEELNKWDWMWRRIKNGRLIARGPVKESLGMGKQEERG
jgi:hypothetical protein